MLGFKNSKLEFWQQLTVTLVVGFALLAVVTSISISLINNSSVKSQIIEQATHLTELIAKQSRLSLLYQSETSAQEIGEVALQFPGVVGITIKSEEGDFLYTEGEPANVKIFSKSGDSAYLFEEDDDSLIFISPIITEKIETLAWVVDSEDETPSAQKLGYIVLVFSKDSLKSIQREILASNIGLSALVALLLLGAVVFLARRLMTPLNQLNGIMNRAELGEMNLRAPLHGPRDFVSMQRSFNTMMEAIEIRDKELRKARDVALETAEVKSQFAANVSHELRTPMNSVLGMLDILTYLGLSAKQMQYLDTAKDSAKNLLTLIDDILSYVHADSGEIVIEKTNTDIRLLVEEVINLLSTQALRKKIDLGYLISDEVTSIPIDVVRVKQVLINLIGNAIKFTDVGEVCLSVYLQPGSDSAHYSHNLIFSVKDTGVGVKKENQDKIFNAFTQEDASTTRKYGGTGLGLAICKQYVGLMGGEIYLESEISKGSIFNVSIPVSVPSTKTQSHVALKHLDEINVLVADQAFVVGEFIKGWVNQHGGVVDLVQKASQLLIQLKKADDANLVYSHLIVGENLPGAPLMDIIRIFEEHSSSSNAQLFILVNPWSFDVDFGVDQYRLIEKPLVVQKLENIFTSDRSEPAISDGLPVPVKFVNYSDKNILIVDDNKANRLVASGMLSQFHCEFDYAQNGQEAIDKIVRKDFDMILMDCNMPVMDGYEATRIIRRLENTVDNLPIIAMTANNLVEESDRCLQAGMNDMLLKPLSLEKFKVLFEKFFKASEVIDFKKIDDITTYHVDKLNELRDSVGEVFVSVIEAFIEDLPIYLNTLRSSISKNDHQQVYELSHTIKGSAANLGADAVAELAKSLEMMGRQRDLRGAQPIYADLENACQIVTDELKIYLQSFEPESKKKTSEDKSVILVADDDRSMRMSLVNSLSANGSRVVEASNGQSVIAICSRSMPDIILVDAVMPEVDGFETCKKIRALPNGSDVPILMITSLEDETSITKAFSVGATDFISKPINFSVMRQRVGRLLQTSKIERHVRELAYRDVLTGLPNRAFFNQQLRHKISRANLNQNNLGILFLDLDRFKMINDSLGHDTGDLILKVAAERISRCVRKNDLVARLGGDEFTVVLEDLESPDVAGDISKKICEALSAPFVFLQQRMFISASIGIAIYPNDGADMNTLVKHADTAMFRAKEGSKDYCYYESQMEDEVTHKLQTERGLRNALETNQIIMYYQPKIDLTTLEVVGFEALARWNHPQRGIIAAGQFITVAEESGLISEFGQLACTVGFSQLEAWNAQGLDVHLAINVSGLEFQGGELRARLHKLFQNHSFPPHMLELEITETMLMEQPELAQTELSLLRDRGISIAIDDFGSGFSSLNYLKRFSVDVLKIDRAFVKDCQKDRNDRAIISGIVTLAKSLNLRVVAEGVEDPLQAEFLREVGCDIAQGYYFGKPRSAEDIQRDIDSGVLKMKKRKTTA